MKKISIIFCLAALGALQLSAQNNHRGVCAAQLADAFNQSIDTIPGRGLAQNYFLWDNGATILVKFMPGGSQKLRTDVMKYAKLWEQYANIHFKFVPDNTPVTQVRVKLTNDNGAWAVLGTKANMVSQKEATLNLDTVGFYVNAGEEYWRGTVIHEFGHVLGLLHEQGYPGGIKWNKKNLYDYYKQTNGWDSAMVDAQVFEVYDQFYTNGTQYDSKSVMHYSVQPWQTLDNVSIRDNNDMSAGDKMLISALYSKSGAGRKEVPRVSLANVKNTFAIANDALRTRIIINPSFDIQTSDKLGEVWCVAQFYDETGMPIADNDDTYNWGGYVAAYTKLNLLPNSKVSYNGAEKNLELSIPLNQVPGYEGKTVIVQTKAYLYDALNKKLIPLYFSDPVEYRMPSR